MSIIDNFSSTLKPLTKIVKKDYAINEEDRSKFSVPLNYVDRRIKEFSEIVPNIALIDEATKDCHAKCRSLHERANAANAEYKKLNTAITRLKKCMNDMDQFSKETEQAWESLHKIEEKLLDNPEISAAPQNKPNNDDPPK